MKLYTEEQVKKAMNDYTNTSSDLDNVMDVEMAIIEQLTPIELPKYMKEETQNLEELINALCIVKAGYGNKSENLVYQNALQIINKRVDYLHLLYQKNEIENKLQTYNQNK
jgi:hypothetical protein